MCDCTNKLPCVEHRCSVPDCKAPCLKNGYCAKQKHQRMNLNLYSYTEATNAQM